MGIFTKRKEKKKKEQEIAKMIEYFKRKINMARWDILCTTKMKEVKEEMRNVFHDELKVPTPKELREYYEKAYEEMKKDNARSIEQTKKAIENEAKAQRDAVDRKFEMLKEVERTGLTPAQMERARINSKR